MQKCRQNSFNYMLPPQDYRGLVLYQEFLITAGSGLSDELVKFFKTRHFDWITLQNLVLFAEIADNFFYVMTCRSKKR